MYNCSEKKGRSQHVTKVLMVIYIIHIKWI